jgi:hypothetical protein
MSYLDGSEQVVTEASLKSWQKNNPNKFRCHYCGHKFVIGNKWRCIYTNDMPGAGGNPLVCVECWEGLEYDAAEYKTSEDEIQAEAKKLARHSWRGLNEMFKALKKGKFWSFIPDCQECEEARRKDCQSCQNDREDERRSRRDPFA